jgi:hypothetical protein
MEYTIPVLSRWCLGFFLPNWREGWSAKFSMGVDVEEGGKYLPCPRKDSLSNVHRVVVDGSSWFVLID